METPKQHSKRPGCGLVAIVAVIVIAVAGAAIYRLVIYPRQVTAELTTKYQEMDALIGKLDLDGLASGYLSQGAATDLDEIRGLVSMAKGAAALVGTLEAESRTTVTGVTVKGSEATAIIERTLHVGAPRLRIDQTVVSTETHQWAKSEGEWKIVSIEGDAFQKLLDAIPNMPGGLGL